MTNALTISTAFSPMAQHLANYQATDGTLGLNAGSIWNATGFTNGYSTIPFCGVNTQQAVEYAKQSQRLNSINIDSNLTLNKQNTAARYLTTSGDDTISRQIAALQRQVKDNKQDNVMTEYGKLVAAVRTYFEDAGYPNVSDEQVKATAERMYAQATGTALVDELKANGNSSFTQGFKQVVTLGLTGNRTYRDNVEQITGEHSKDKLDTAVQWTGRITGGLALFEGVRILSKFAKSSAGKTTFNLLRKVL